MVSEYGQVFFPIESSGQASSHHRHFGSDRFCYAAIGTQVSVSHTLTHQERECECLALIILPFLNFFMHGLHGPDFDILKSNFFQLSSIWTL